MHNVKKESQRAEVKKMIVLKNVTQQEKNGVCLFKNMYGTIERGEFIALIGTPISGKSLFLQVLAGLAPLREGDIMMEGTSIVWHKKSKWHTKIKKIFKDPPFGKEYKEQQPSKFVPPVYMKVDELVRKQKRMELSIALTAGANVVLMDGPTCFFDINAWKRCMDYLSKVNKQYNVTIIVNIDTFEIAEKYVQRIIALKNGEVVLDEEVEEIPVEMVEAMDSQQPLVVYE